MIQCATRTPESLQLRMSLDSVGIIWQGLAHVRAEFNRASDECFEAHVGATLNEVRRLTSFFRGIYQGSGPDSTGVPKANSEHELESSGSIDFHARACVERDEQAPVTILIGRRAIRAIVRSMATVGYGFAIGTWE